MFDDLLVGVDGVAQVLTGGFRVGQQQEQFVAAAFEDHHSQRRIVVDAQLTGLDAAHVDPLREHRGGRQVVGIAQLLPPVRGDLAAGV